MKTNFQTHLVAHVANNIVFCSLYFVILPVIGLAQEMTLYEIDDSSEDLALNVIEYESGQKIVNVFYEDAEGKVLVLFVPKSVKERSRHRLAGYKYKVLLDEHYLYKKAIEVIGQRCLHGSDVDQGIGNASLLIKSEKKELLFEDCLVYYFKVGYGEYRRENSYWDLNLFSHHQVKTKLEHLYVVGILLDDFSY